MVKKINDLILESLIIIPGVVGIASMNFDETSSPLKKQKFKDGILIEKQPRGLVISIALIIKNNISTTIILKGINNTIKNILKKKEIKLHNLKLYIRGIE